ncbi:putative OB-fold protein [Neobacillus niacini]|uniref:Zn-ribbon domain-containing OB-fold protein n=1 Tax=Neobacillus niacini TaxID=86668 RepID=UPI0028560FD2|nr:OB-fold domain-containing protein [Neobacillus niacini]MDR7076067.1 putative OB-fold protein [Neobacillus niacini]
MVNRPLPVINQDNRWHWEKLKEGIFVIQECAGCKTRRWPIAPVCYHCFSKEVELIQCEGIGTIDSWVVFHHSYYPYFADKLPYIVVQVKLAEGIRVTANLLNIDPSEVKIGMSVRLTYQQVLNSDVILPQFVPY